MRIPNTDGRNVFNIHLASPELLVAGVAGLRGSVPFDLRQR
jgi:hypothetical protein